MKFIINWYNGLIYPFKEKDWKEKMWLIPTLAFVLTPFFELLVLNGWRVELVRRMGVKSERMLPKADLTSVIKYALHGIKLYLIAGVYVVIPIVIFRIFGINPFRQLLVELWNIGNYIFNNDTGLPLTTLFWRSFWAIAREVLIENAWLVFYYPYYRTATIRYALTGKIRKSHLAVYANIKFVLKHVLAFLIMIVNQLIDKFILFFANLVLAFVLSPIGAGLLAPFFFFYADFWTSGYEYGEMAIKMVEEEYPDLLDDYTIDPISEEEIYV